MTKKNIFLTALFVVLVVVWAIYFSGWFKKEKIEIMHDVHDQRGRRAGNNRTGPVIEFGFEHPCELIDVKVISLSELKTNISPSPLWHLVSDSNSVPVKGFSYGQWIDGMKPALVNRRAQPLLPGESYRLSLVTVRHEEGECEFRAPSPPK